MSIQLKHFVTHSLLAVLFLFCQGELAAQECAEPIITSFDQATDTSITVHWFSNDAEVKFYQLDYGEPPFSPDNIPAIDSIYQTEITIQNLHSSTRYALFARSVCENGYSRWNGPLFFNTNLNNPSICQTNLLIGDNNCPAQTTFQIQVDENGSALLGESIFLTEVHLIIEHDWPPDIRIALQNPAGNEILLSANHGIGFDNYGSPLEENCFSRAIFSDQSCYSLSAWQDSLTGNFLPEEGIFELNDGTSANGIWKLLVCDRAEGDIGVLKYVELVFSRADCQNPVDVFLDEINDQSVRVNWNQLENCDSVFLELGPKGFIPGEGSVYYLNCQNSVFHLSGLFPGTDYEFYLWSVCSNSVGCPYSFRTTCHPVTLRENFNAYQTCEPECGSKCPINGIWTNSMEDTHDWILHKGNTLTEFTGPEKDVSGFGNYIYIESSGTTCSVDTVILESLCLNIISNFEACDLSFQYHVYGNETGQLILQISTDNGLNWVDIWSIQGDQGNQWKEALVDLGEFSGIMGKFRFIAFGGNGSLNDIALDKILFFGSTSGEGQENIFYFDQDNDGYGSADFTILSCSVNPPAGFVTNADDCDDANDQVNPGVSEIACNLVDENCNGMEDDQDVQNPLIVEIASIKNESCLGNQDGFIHLYVSGGSQPYSVEWNQGDTTTQIENLSTGTYSAIITDQNNCAEIVDSINISYNSSLLIDEIDTHDPSCEGKSDGSIDIEVSGGNLPNQFQWSHGDTVQNPVNLAPGIYVTTVTDQQGCKVVSDSIYLEPVGGFVVQPIVLQNARCYGETNGRIVLGVSGGSGPYTYLWNTGATTNSIQNLAAGAYSCTVTNQSGCIETINDIIIAQSAPLSAQMTGLDNIACHGDQTGNIDISVQGGTQPYKYIWSNGSTTKDQLQLPAGSYSVTVSDRNACTAVLSNIQIDQSPLLAVDLDSIGHVNCPLSLEGFIKISAHGGTGEYQYFWNVDGNFEEFADSLQSNTYKVTLIDQFGCKSTLDQLTVQNRAVPLIVNAEEIQSNLCPGDSLAGIQAEALNGTAPFDFNWSAGVKHIVSSPADSIFQLSSGTYKVTVTDSEGCVGVSGQVLINEIPGFYFQIIDQVDNPCYGDSLGILEVDVYGGTRPYQLTWSNGETTELIQNIPAGPYSLTLVDANHCIFTSDTIRLNQSDPIDIQAEITEATNGMANGQIMLVVEGGTPPHVIEWDENSGQQIGPLATGLSPGYYEVEITDFLNCTMDTVLFVDNVTGIHEQHILSQVELYPNPTEGIIHIKLPSIIDPGNLEIEIYSVKLEKVLIASTLHRQNSVLDLTGSQSGLYWLKLRYKNDLKVIPVIIIH